VFGDCVLIESASSQVAWPPLVKKCLSYMSVFYFDLNLTAPEVRKRMLCFVAPAPPPHLRPTCRVLMTFART